MADVTLFFQKSRLNLGGQTTYPLPEEQLLCVGYLCDRLRLHSAPTYNNRSYSNRCYSNRCYSNRSTETSTTGTTIVVTAAVAASPGAAPPPSAITAACLQTAPSKAASSPIHFFLDWPSVLPYGWIDIKFIFLARVYRCFWQAC